LRTEDWNLEGDEGGVVRAALFMWVVLLEFCLRARDGLCGASECSQE
jgi:hypothetical protein